MEDDVMQGYGSAEDLGAPPSDATLAGTEAPPEEGGDVEAMIAEGVQAFMETQDPEIAVQVVMMLAESMGLAGGQGPQGAPAGGDPMAGGGAPAPSGGMPMAKNGGKFGWFGNEGIASDFQKFVSQK